MSRPHICWVALAFAILSLGFSIPAFSIALVVLTKGG